MSRIYSFFSQKRSFIHFILKRHNHIQRFVFRTGECIHLNCFTAYTKKEKDLKKTNIA